MGVDHQIIAAGRRFQAHHAGVFAVGVKDDLLGSALAAGEAAQKALDTAFVDAREGGAKRLPLDGGLRRVEQAAPGRAGGDDPAIGVNHGDGKGGVDDELSGQPSVVGPMGCADRRARLAVHATSPRSLWFDRNPIRGVLTLRAEGVGAFCHIRRSLPVSPALFGEGRLIRLRLGATLFQLPRL